MNNDWTTSASSWTYISRNLDAGDTLDISLILRAGDNAAKVFFTYSSEYVHWANNENFYLLWGKDHFVYAGSYTFRVPTVSKSESFIVAKKEVISW